MKNDSTTRLIKTTCSKCGGKGIVPKGANVMKSKQCPMCIDPETKKGTGEVTKIIKI